MRAVIVLLLTLMSCPFITVFVPPSTGNSVPLPTPTFTPTFTPTPTPTAAVPEAHVEISADQTTIRVGDTVTITGVPRGIGLSIFMLNLTSGLSVRVRYDNQDQTVVTTDPLFEVVSISAEMYRATFVLRALAAGTTEATISASGEVSAAAGEGGYSGVYGWGVRTSPALTLTINP